MHTLQMYLHVHVCVYSCQYVRTIALWVLAIRVDMRTGGVRSIMYLRADCDTMQI